MKRIPLEVKIFAGAIVLLLILLWIANNVAI